MDSLFLLRLAKLLAAHPGYGGNTLATIGCYAAGDSHIFLRFEKGGDCTTQRAKRLGLWFSENWPDDLEWPRDIPRPDVRVAA